jgi:hypothetical protein
MLEERSRYHSVSLPEKQPANYSIDYKPSTLPDMYDSTTFASYPRTGLARFIPQDERIELAFDLHWQAKKDEHEWKMKPFADENEQYPTYLREKAELRIGSLEPFGEEIQMFGNFSVWDVDPSKPENGHVLYDLGHSEPYVVIPKESIHDEENREVTRFIPLMLLTSYDRLSNLSQVS